MAENYGSSLVEFGLDDQNWINDYENWPSVLAFEYVQLRDRCINDLTCSAAWCLRVNFETLLKLETLLAYAWAEKQMPDDFKYSTICLLTTSNLTFGAWMELAKRLLDGLKDLDIALPEEIKLEKIRKEYASMDVVHWRNDAVCHGMLVLDQDEDFKEDLIEMIRDYIKIIGSLSSSLDNQQLIVGEEVLSGPSKARVLEVKGKISCRLVKSGELFSVDPFILIRKHEKKGTGVYFFDNQKTKTLTIYQAYAEKSSIHETNAYFLRLRNMLDAQGIHLDADPEDEYLSENEHWEAERVYMEQEFVTPKHLQRWVKSCLQGHEKGTFLLQMERGTGKSLFTDKLDGLHPDPIKFDGVEIRTYHITRTQMMGENDAESRIEWLWSRFYEGGSWQHSPRFVDYEKNGMNKNEAMAAFLQNSLRYVKRNLHKKKILMVFDGLDEIVDSAMWNLFPTADQLPDGVYILYTSRDPVKETIPEENAVRIKALAPTAQMVFSRDSEDHKQFLRQFAQKAAKKYSIQLNDSLTDDLIKLADYRTIYLSLYCTLMNHGIPFEQLPVASSVVEYYLEYLETRYGETEKYHLREILALLAVLGEYEPLTLGEIGALTAETRITLKLIGMLRDLLPMLKVDRSPDGNRYSIINPDIAQRLAESIPETEETIGDVISLSVEQLKQGYPIELKDTEVAAAHVCELMVRHQGPVVESFESVLNQYVEQGKQVENQQLLNNTQLRRFEDYYRQSLVYCDWIYGRKDKRTLYALEALANLCSINGKYIDAITFQQSAVELSENLDNEEQPYISIECLISLAIYYKEVRPISDLAMILVYIGKLLDRIPKEQLGRITRLMHYYHLKAYCKLSQGNVKDAVKDYQIGYEVFRERWGEENPDTLHCMHEYGYALYMQKEYIKALDIQRRSLELHKIALGDRDLETLSAMNNLAILLSDMGNNDEAIPLIKETISLREEVIGSDHPMTLESKFNLAMMYKEQGKFEKAYVLLENAWKKQKNVIGEEAKKAFETLFQMVDCLCVLGKFNKAEKLIEEYLPLCDKVLGTESEMSIHLVKYMLQICYEKNNRTKARRYALRLGFKSE